MDLWMDMARSGPLAARCVREEILEAIRKLVPFPHQGQMHGPPLCNGLAFRQNVRSSTTLCRVRRARRTYAH